MTDRVKGFTVSLKEDIRVDDVQMIIDAISMIKGVQHVEPSIVKHEDYFARERVKSEMREKMWKFVDENF